MLVVGVGVGTWALPFEGGPKLLDGAWLGELERFMESKQGYRDLVIWQRSVDLVPAVYSALRSFPKVENFSLSDQIRRAAISIPANVAEGQARQHKKEFLQHLAIARGSLAELHTLFIVANRLAYISDEKLAALEAQMSEVGRPLNGLMAKLDNKSAIASA